MDHQGTTSNTNYQGERKVGQLSNEMIELESKQKEMKSSNHEFNLINQGENTLIDSKEYKQSRENESIKSGQERNQDQMDLNKLSQSQQQNFQNCSLKDEKQKESSLNGEERTKLISKISQDNIDLKRHETQNEKHQQNILSDQLQNEIQDKILSNAQNEDNQINQNKGSEQKSISVQINSEQQEQLKPNSQINNYSTASQSDFPLLSQQGNNQNTTNILPKQNGISISSVPATTEQIEQNNFSTLPQQRVSITKKLTPKSNAVNYSSHSFNIVDSKTPPLTKEQTNKISGEQELQKPIQNNQQEKNIIIPTENKNGQLPQTPPISQQQQNSSTSNGIPQAFKNDFFKIIMDQLQQSNLSSQNAGNKNKVSIDLSGERSKADLGKNAQVISFITSLEKASKMSNQELAKQKSDYQQLLQSCSEKDQKIDELRKQLRIIREGQDAASHKNQSSDVVNQGGNCSANKGPLSCSSTILDFDDNLMNKIQIKQFKEQQMLSKKDLDPQLSKEIKQFENDVNDFNEKMKPSYQFLLNKLRSLLTTKLQGIKFDIYGSFATDLCLPWSEIDIVLTLTDNTQDMNRDLLLRKVYDLLQEQADTFEKFEKSINVSNTTIPSLKVTCTEKFNKKKLNISIMEGLHNELRSVTLVNNYIQHYKILRPLVLVLKHFLYCQQINDPYLSGLSSYYLILMLVFFLQLKKQVDDFPLSEGDLLIQFLIFYGIDEQKVRNIKPFQIDANGEQEQIIQYHYTPFQNESKDAMLIIVDPLAQNNFSRSTVMFGKVKTALACAYTTIFQMFKCSACKGVPDLKENKSCLILKRLFYLTGKIIDKGEFCWWPLQQQQSSFLSISPYRH